MAKIKCPACGTKYTGNFCPTCSAPAPEGGQKKGKGKIFLMIAAVLVVVIVIASAGGKSDEPRPATAVSTGGNVTNAEQAEAENSGASEATAEQGASGGSVTLEAQEIYNSGGIAVTATGLNRGMLGSEIKITVVNSSEQDVLLTTDALSVNGFMLPLSSLYCEVAAGKSANDTINLLSSELKTSGVETVADVAFYLKVSDASTWEAIDTSDLITLSTSASGTFEQPYDDSGDVIYDKDGIRVICKGLKDDAIWDGAVVFSFENNSGRKVSIYAENVSVNGFMETASLWADLRPETKNINSLRLLDLDDLELDSLDDVENIELTLRIIDGDSWETIDTTEPITLYFN